MENEDSDYLGDYEGRMDYPNNAYPGLGGSVNRDIMAQQMQA